MSGDSSYRTADVRIPFNLEQQISGGLDELFHMPIIKIIFNGDVKSYRGMIDTGAYYCSISQELAFNFKDQLTTGKARYEDLNDGRVKESNKFNLEFEIEGIKFLFRESFVIHPSLGSNNINFLIGTEFIKRCKKFTYNGADDNFHLEI